MQFSSLLKSDLDNTIPELCKKLAEEGIEINLDPPCVALFKQASEEATVIKQRSKAEIAGHVSRGKW